MDIFLNFALSSHIIVSLIHLILCSEKAVRVCDMVFLSISLILVAKFLMLCNFNFWASVLIGVVSY